MAGASRSNGVRARSLPPLNGRGRPKERRSVRDRAAAELAGVRAFRCGCDRHDALFPLEPVDEAGATEEKKDDEAGPVAAATKAPAAVPTHAPAAQPKVLMDLSG